MCGPAGARRLSDAHGRFCASAWDGVWVGVPLRNSGRPGGPVGGLVAGTAQGDEVVQGVAAAIGQGHDVVDLEPLLRPASHAHSVTSPDLGPPLLPAVGRPILASTRSWLLVERTARARAQRTAHEAGAGQAHSTASTCTGAGLLSLRSSAIIRATMASMLPALSERPGLSILHPRRLCLATAAVA
jgi:hypothetical protein